MRNLLIFRFIYYKLSPKGRLLARRILYFPIDVLEKIAGKRDPMCPPRGLIYTGSGDFKKQGEKFLNYFIEWGDLQPHHHVLDIGSGIGRMAVPLTKYLNKTGSYKGFDVVDTGVKWCQRNISKKYPNFQFTYVPLKNDLYNLSAHSNSASFIFPYPNQSFDFIILTSVFTHMIKDDVEQYFKEINRVLKKGGTCFATFFTYQIPYIPQVSDSVYFPYDYNEYRIMDQNVKEANVAYQLDYIKNLAVKNEFRLHKIYLGQWDSSRNQKDTYDFQDILIFKK